MGISKDKERELAKRLYLEGTTQKAIAERVGVNEKTIQRWVETHNWEALKVSLLSTRENQIRMLYSQLKCLNEVIEAREQKYADPGEANTLLKLSTAIKKMETETGLGETIQVAKNFLNFVSRLEPSRHKELTEMFDKYIASML